MSNSEEVVFCTDLTGTPEQHRRTRVYFPTVFDESEEVLIQYHRFMHEAEIFVLALADKVEAGKMTANEARKEFEPYREHMPDLYDPEMVAEFENGFPGGEWFSEWGIGPGTSDFWEAADECEISGVYFNEGEHPGGNPVFYIYRKEALNELQEALAGRYKIVVRQHPNEYESSDPAEAMRIIEQARAGS